MTLFERWRVNQRLLLIVCVLAVLVQLELHFSARRGQLTVLNPERVEHIVLTQAPNAEALVFERSQGQWQLTAPLTAAADARMVESLLAIATAAVTSPLNLTATERAAVGLDPPRMKLQLNDTKLYFGRIEPISRRVYVQHQQRVFLLDERWLIPLTRTAETFVGD